MNSALGTLIWNFQRCCKLKQQAGFKFGQNHEVTETVAGVHFNMIRAQANESTL